jgi:predicted ATP-grasp superfamily ATP-dependent carboligase
MSQIFLFGNLRASLTLARSLSRAGHVIHAGVDDPDPYLFASRHVKGVLHHARPDLDPEAALRQLVDYLERNPSIEALIPVSEVATRLISRNRGRFPARVRLILAEERLVAACSDKAGLFALCDRLGLPIARRLEVRDLPALKQAVARVGTPCIVKPLESTEFVLGEKAVALRSTEEAERRFTSWPEGHQALCVQSFVEGPRHNVYFGAFEGRLLGAAEIEIRRTDRYDGTGYAVEGVSVAPHPVIREATESLLAALNYTGVGCAQFMVAHDGREVSFLEINPRLGGNYKIAETCGLPLSLWMYEIACGGRPAGKADPWAYPVGRTYIHSKGDIGGLRKEWARGVLTPAAALRWAAAAAVGVFRPNHLTLALSDPLPTLLIYLHRPMQRLGLRRRRAEAAPAPLPAPGAA